jgi:hypothetical protein
MPDEPTTPGRLDRRQFVETALKACGAAAPLLVAVIRIPTAGGQETGGAAATGYDPTDHYYGMGVDIEKCIGRLRRCVRRKTTSADAALQYVGHATSSRTTGR